MNIKRILILLILAVTLTSCSAIPFDESDFIGKSSSEIIAEYGTFDCTSMPAEDDGLYRNARCGYTVREAQKGLFGSSPEELFFITFDENAIAAECEIGYRPAG